MKVTTQSGTADFNLLPKASDKSQDTFYKILMLIVVVVIIYALYKVYQGIGFVEKLPENTLAGIKAIGDVTLAGVKTISEAPINYYNQEQKAVDTAITQAVGVNKAGQTYDQWLTSQNDIIESVVRLGNTITPTPILSGAAQLGATTRSYIEGAFNYFNSWL